MDDLARAVDDDPRPWSLPRRLGFRFVFAYLLIYNLPFLFWALPGLEWLDKGWSKAKDAFLLWIAEDVLRLGSGFRTGPNGSGDTVLDYVALPTTAALALLVVIAWSIAQRRATSHPRAYEVLRVFLRYCLAATMLGYGLMKVFHRQFPFPADARLGVTYGDSSPMGLLWTFMGYSGAYNVFTGGAEVVGGLLLLWRRTTMLGALVLVAVMANVVMLNFCYDVPVKLYSSHLLLMSVFLVGPDLRRLVDVLVLHRPTAPPPARRRHHIRWIEWTRRGVKTAFIAWILYDGIHGYLKAEKKAAAATPAEIEGSWFVDGFVADGVEAPLVLGDPLRWKTVGVTPSSARIGFMDDSSRRYAAKIDAKEHRLETTDFTHPANDVMTYSVIDHDHVRLEGTFEQRALRVELRRAKPRTYLLVTRGFHWVNEVPFSR